MTDTCTTTKRFALGQIVITPNALEHLDSCDVGTSLRRHASGDWGDFGSEGAKANERAVAHGFRLLSAYTDRHGTRFWIITEADRNYTTILLPEDY